MFISVITPTYNRGYCIEKLYKSLCEQTNKNFEWIVLDDGSSDDTQKRVEEYRGKNNGFAVSYFYQENGGKHRALNSAIEKAQGDYCFIVDSDDILTGDAIETIYLWLEDVNDLSHFAGVAGKRGGMNGETLGEFPDADVIDATNIERIRKHLCGDKAEVYSTTLLRKYPFPEFEGEKFLREDAVWDLIAHNGYKIRWHKKVIYKCEYLEDGLTKNSKDIILNNFQGYTYVQKNKMNFYSFPYNWLSLVVYMYYAEIKGMEEKDILEAFEISQLRYCIAKILLKFWKKRKKL